MGVLRVLAAEICEVLARLDLQVSGQRNGLQVSLIELKHDIAKAFEVRVHRAIDGDFGVAHGETALDGVMVAQFEGLGGIGSSGPTNVHEGIEADVHVSRTCASNGYGLGGGPGGGR